MILRQDWVITNIRERLVNPSAFFDCTLVPERFIPTTFKRACKHAAIHIAKMWPCYLALSGGLDSTHVLNTFCENGLEITPIIIHVQDSPTWVAEARYGLEACAKWNVQPVVFSIDMMQLLHVFETIIVKRINGMGVWSTPSVIAAYIAAQRGGVIITGEHIFDQKSLLATEYDYYIEALVTQNFCPFYMYSPAIIHAMLIEGNWEQDEAATRAELYEMPAQGKQVHTFTTRRTVDEYNRIKEEVMDHPRFYKELGSPADVLRMLDRFAF